MFDYVCFFDIQDSLSISSWSSSGLEEYSLGGGHLYYSEKWFSIKRHTATPSDLKKHVQKYQFFDFMPLKSHSQGSTCLIPQIEQSYWTEEIIAPKLRTTYLMNTGFVEKVVIVSDHRRAGAPWPLQIRGAKFEEFPAKFKSLIFTKSKSTKIFQRNTNFSENPMMWKKLVGPWPLLPPPRPRCPRRRAYYHSTIL